MVVSDLRAQVARPDSVVVLEDVYTWLDVLANDDLSWSGTRIVTPPKNGNGSFNYYQSDENYNGQDSLQYVLTDHKDDPVSSAWVHITVLPVNDPPRSTRWTAPVELALSSPVLILDLDNQGKLFVDPEGDDFDMEFVVTDPSVARVELPNPGRLEIAPLTTGATDVWLYATDVHGAADSSRVIIAVHLDTPSLLSMPDENLANPALMTLSWTTVPEAVDYQVQISLNDRFAGLIENVTIPAPLLESSSALSSSFHLDGGLTYYWRVRARKGDLISSWSEVQTFSTFEIEECGVRPNYPNPVVDITHIGVETPITTIAKLTILDLVGRKVAESTHELNGEGFHEILFDASTLASGVYVYRLEAEKCVENRLLNVIR